MGTVVDGNRCRREPFPGEVAAPVAAPGIHCIVFTGTGQHGKPSRANRPPRDISPRELATTANFGMFAPGSAHRGFSPDVNTNHRDVRVFVVVFIILLIIIRFFIRFIV